MDIDGVKIQLLLAMGHINKKYPNLQGIFLYGSIVRNDPNPQDIDIIPVLIRKESERENPWKRGEELIREYLNEFFPDFSEPKQISKPGINGRTDYQFIPNILHAGNGVVYTTEPDSLRRMVKQAKSGLEHFIGTDDATQCLKDILKEK